MKKGRIHIYCGDGKGKTTAATGLAVRAAGSGMKVLFSRFLKNEDSGELKILDAVEGITVLHMDKSFGFFNTLSEAEKVEAQETYARLWDTVCEKAVSGEYDMLVVDEFMAAYHYGLIDHTKSLAFLEKKPKELEVVLTGRNPDEKLIGLANYVSEIRKIKHPFDREIRARRGIEY